MDVSHVVQLQAKPHNQGKLSKAEGFKTWGATGVKTPNQKSGEGEDLKPKGGKGVCELRL